MTYDAIPNFLCEVGLLGRPDKSVAGELSVHQLQRLPRKEDLSIVGFVDVRPEEGRRVACDLGGLHQPAGDLGGLDLGLEVVPIGREQVHMREEISGHRIAGIIHRRHCTVYAVCDASRPSPSPSPSLSTSIDDLQPDQLVREWALAGGIRF